MFFTKLTANVWMFLFFTVLALKFLFVIFGGDIDTFGLGGGNDADGYADAIDRGDDFSVNTWPIILSLLNDFNFYSRLLIKYSLLIISSIVIPFLIAQISLSKGASRKNNTYWSVVFMASIYPVLFYYSLDIYRDVFMTFVFMLGCFALKGVSIHKLKIKGFLYFIFGLAVVLALYGLREYLGVAYGLALMFVFFNNFSLFNNFFKIKPIFIFIIYIFVVFVFYYSGSLELLFTYRSSFEGYSAGSNFGLTFSSVYFFVPEFLLSWIYQVFGFWPFSFLAVMLFILEGIPFAFAFFYVNNNYKFMTSFCWSLLVFFVSYNTVWVLGNDNLGTAWRLRIYSYISIFVIFLLIYQEKNKMNLK